MSAPTLLLVDGSSYLYRAFHALPDLRTRAGEPTGAIRGVISMLRKLRSDRKLAADARYGAVVFDAPGGTFRDALYPAYKANRAETPADLRAQIAPIHAMVRAMGWPVLQVAGIEADDVIGTLAEQAWRRGWQTVVATGDKDLAQLVNDHITLIDTMVRNGEPPKRMDRAAVLEKFGVPPEHIIDWLALVGDAVDNVPGVAKVGPKTAVKWLQQHGGLEGVMAAAEHMGGAVGQHLREALPWLPTARTLVTIRTDCDLQGHLAEFETGLTLQPEDPSALRTLFERYEMRTLLEQGAPATPVVATSEEGGVPVAAAPTYETILTQADLTRWCELIAAASVVALDTETTALDPFAARLVGLSLALESGQACYVPLAHRYAGAPTQLDLNQVLRQLRPWLEQPAARKVGQNIKYDMHVLANHGIALAGIAHDTLLQSYVLEAHRTHGLGDLAKRHLNRATLAYEDVAGKGAAQIGFDQVPLERATAYAAEDAEVTMQVHQVLWPRIAAEPKLQDIYQRIELPAMAVLQRMERCGVLIDSAALQQQSHELGAQLLALETQAQALAGQPFNLNSPKQMAEVLFNQMGLPVHKKTATGAPSTDEEVLARLALDYPLPKLILQYRSASKLKSTYTDKLPRMVNAQTGRVHTHYAQATAVTGRLASSEPNLQNIPIRTPEGRRIREAFIATPGHMLVSADYSQIELRIMAHVSGDAHLLQAFAQEQDVHQATAAEVFGVALEDVTAEQRRYAKTINFGLIYGMSAFGLAAQLDIPRDAARQWIDRYFTRYPGVAQYMESTRALAQRQGYVETVLGRRLWLAEIHSPSGPRRAAAERQAINAPLQGTAADIIKLAMIAVQNWLDQERLQAQLVLQVHDELVLEVPQTEVAHVVAALPTLMANVLPLAVPLRAEVGVGANWDQAH